jgi:phage terminase large subunit
MENVLGEKPWELQRAILNSVRDNKRTAVKSCHGAGKSYTAARAILWWTTSFPGAIAVSTAPTFRQVQKVVWQEVARAYKKSRVPLGGECLTTELRIEPGWFAIGIATDDPDSFQGIHSYSGRVLVVLDEASGIPRDLWPAFEGITTGDNCRILSIGNPTDPLSAFADEFKDSEVCKFKISAWDTPNLLEDREVIPGLVTKGWVEEKRRRWGEDNPLWISRVMAEFPEDSDRVLYPLQWLERAQSKNYATGSSDEPRLGVDVARYGDDESVIALKVGHKVRIIDKMRKQDTNEVSGRVIRKYRECNARQVNIDVIGIGAGVVDRCKEAGLNVCEVNVGTKSSDPERFVSLRDEMYWAFRESLERDEVDLDRDDVVLAQASGIKYQTDSRGRIKIEPKDRMKQRMKESGHPSPDRLEAILLAWFDSSTMGPVEIW